MGYNGNNRGRTHKWSGAFSKSSYNKGLSMFSKAIGAPFVLLSQSGKKNHKNTSQNTSSVNLDDTFNAILSKPSLKTRYPSVIDRRHTIFLCILNGIIIMNVYQILDLLLGVTQWELWDGLIFGPALCFIGECIVLGIPIGIVVALLKRIRKRIETKFVPIFICSLCLIVGSIVGLYFLGQNWDSVLSELSSPATFVGVPIIGLYIYILVYTTQPQSS